jgi:Asp-tRNA(Asn)/Glu-tRNA(Gln) amidotransferase A subunit family amidase
LPIGVQLVGKPFEEETLLRLAYVYEEHYSTFGEMTPPTIRQ